MPLVPALCVPESEKLEVQIADPTHLMVSLRGVVEEIG
jgi:hypothetical protein